MIDNNEFTNTSYNNIVIFRTINNFLTINEKKGIIISDQIVKLLFTIGTNPKSWIVVEHIMKYPVFTAPTIFMGRPISRQVCYQIIGVLTEVEFIETTDIKIPNLANYPGERPYIYHLFFIKDLEGPDDKRVYEAADRYYQKKRKTNLRIDAALKREEAQKCKEIMIREERKNREKKVIEYSILVFEHLSIDKIDQLSVIYEILDELGVTDPRLRKDIAEVVITKSLERK